MTTKLSDPEHMMELRIRIKPETMRLLKRLMASDRELAGKTMSTVGGMMLASGIMQQNANFLRRARAEADDRRQARDVLQLVERGFTISAIAALTKKTYSEIAREIGRGIDAEREHARHLT
jgi:hypothetical protein